MKQFPNASVSAEKSRVCELLRKEGSCADLKAQYEKVRSGIDDAVNIGRQHCSLPFDMHPMIILALTELGYQVYQVSPTEVRVAWTSRPSKEVHWMTAEQAASCSEKSSAVIYTEEEFLEEEYLVMQNITSASSRGRKKCLVQIPSKEIVDRLVQAGYVVDVNYILCTVSWESVPTKEREDIK